MIPVVHKMRDASKGHVVRLVKYVSSDNGKPDRIGDIFISNCASPNPFIVSREMEAVQHLNTRSSDDKTFHLSISFPTGEKPSSEQLKMIEEKVANALGYEEYQRISVVHNDTDNVHMHMVVNKIHPTRNTIRTVRNDHGILAKVCAEIEKELSLSADNHEAKKTHAEARIDSLEHKTGVEAFAAYARDHVKGALEASKTWEDFHNALADKGIQVKLQGNGIIFADHAGEYAAKGSSVGRNYSKANIENQLGAFEAAGKNRAIARFSAAYEAKPKIGEKELYAEYRAHQAEAKNGRAEQMEALQTEQRKAIEAAKEAAMRQIASGTLASLFRSQRLKQYLTKNAEQKLVREIRETFDAKREAIATAAREGYADWLKQKAEAGDDRAAVSLAKMEAKEPAREKGAQAAQAPKGGKADREEGKTAPERPQSLYAEYKDLREREADARRRLLDELRKEQGRALDEARAKARQSAEAQPLDVLRSKRLSRYMQRHEEQKAASAVRKRFGEKRRGLFKATKTMGYVDWLKKRAQTGDVRAILSLREKGETAPEVISITSKQLQYAKIVAAKIAAVTGRGTLFYKVDRDIYRDNGKNISLKNGVTDTGIKNGLLIAASKFNAPLTLEGSEDFKRRCVEIARRERLDLTFDNRELEAARKRPLEPATPEKGREEAKPKAPEKEVRDRKNKGLSR